MKNLHDIINPVKKVYVGSYNVDMRHLKAHFDEYNVCTELVLNPDFQRGNVWTNEQQIAFIENLLRGVPLNNIIYVNNLFNIPNVQDERLKDKVLVVDGLQRLTAMFDFMDNKFKVFDNQLSYSDILNHENKSQMREIFKNCLIKINEIKLTSYSELLEFYINYNSGGTVHSQSEIQRVKDMLKNETTMTT